MEQSIILISLLLIIGGVKAEAPLPSDKWINGTLFESEQDNIFKKKSHPDHFICIAFDEKLNDWVFGNVREYLDENNIKRRSVCSYYVGFYYSDYRHHYRSAKVDSYYLLSSNGIYRTHISRATLDSEYLAAGKTRSVLCEAEDPGTGKIGVGKLQLPSIFSFYFYRPSCQLPSYKAYNYWLFRVSTVTKNKDEL